MNNVVILKEESAIDRDALAAEQAFFGALFNSPESYINAASIIKPEYFIYPLHSSLLNAFIECRNSGLKGDLTEICRCLGSKAEDLTDQDETVRAYCVKLFTNAITLSASRYAKEVRDYWSLRQLRNVMTKSFQGGLPENNLNDVFDRFDEIRRERADEGCSSASVEELCMAVLEQSAKISSKQEKEPGLTTGIPELDRIMLGFRPGELVIIAGRPGAGKSTVATSLALAASHTSKGDRRGGVGFLGLELGDNAIGARMLADICSGERDAPSHSDIRAGRITDNQLWMMQDARDKLRQHSLMIDYRSSVTVSDVEAICRSWQRDFEKQGRKLEAVFVDYLKQVRTSDRYRGNRVYEIGEITAGLRDIAKRLQICVILLVQLNRAVESRGDKRPMLADLRESGDIENDADVVLMIYREAYYLKRELRTADVNAFPELNLRCKQLENALEVIVTKNRNGEGEATVHVYCDIAHSAVRPLIKGAYQ